MEPLPLPPPVGMHIGRSPRPVRAGQLTSGWRSVFLIGWAGVILGFGSVLKSARTMGLSTWWLGPEADPRNLLIIALPFLVALVVVGLTLRHVRQLPFIGIVGALAEGAIAAGDIGRFNGLAVIELVTAGVGLFVSVAAFAGRLRVATPHDPALDPVLAGVAAHPAGGVPLPAPVD